MADEPYTTLLDEALEAWEDARKGTLDEAREIPDGRYGWSPAEESRSVAELLLHIHASSLMAVGELTREDGDFTRQPFPDFMEEYAGDLPDDPAPDELRDLLAMGFAEGAAALRGVGELHMLQHIRRFDGLRGSRLAWLHHHVAHEMYHRGQLALYARQMGRVPALTQRIRGS